MAPLIPIALQLIQFAPHLMRYFGAGETSSAIVDKVIDVAQTVSGASTPEEALEALKSSGKLQMAFQQRTLELDTELERAYLTDRQDARKRDMAFIAAGTRNYRADALVGLSWAVVIFIIAAIWNIPELSEFVKSTLTLLLGRVLGYIDQAFQFEFGTTRDSKTKNATIRELSRN